jgi:tripartite-type tricarboxylate transporter receptor subunit TctC
MSRTAVLVLAWFFSPFTVAQDYPSRAVTMVVPFPPGGVADIVGRPLAAMMERSLKQPVVIVNRTGAGGALGMREVAKAAPDGYTILMGLSSISIFPVSERVNGKQPAYELKDFAPIALVTADPTVLVVRADSPYRSVRDFVEAAKAKPGKINYSSSGVYARCTCRWRSSPTPPSSSSHSLPRRRTGGHGAARRAGAALASGSAAAIGQIKGGKMRALASWSTERLQLLPDIPTFGSSGMTRCPTSGRACSFRRARRNIQMKAAPR